jgi:hypothetical protein
LLHISEIQGFPRLKGLQNKAESIIRWSKYNDFVGPIVENKKKAEEEILSLQTFSNLMTNMYDFSG